MRIIVTKNGENELLEIAKSISQSNINKNSHRSQSMENYQIAAYNSKTIKFAPRKLQKQSTVELISHYEEESMIQPKIIRIKKPKLNSCVIKAVEQSKHDNAMINMKLRLLPNCQREKNEDINHNSNGVNKDISYKKIPIRDIIDPQAFKHMIARIAKEKELKTKHYKMSHLEFRSIAKSTKSFYEKLNDTLDMRINCKEKWYLEYVKNKKEISPVFLNNLCKFDAARLSNLDRLCKLVETKQTMNKPIRIEKYEEKNKFNGKKDYDEIRKTMIKLENQFLLQNTLINKYKANLNQKKAIDEDYYDQTKSYWKKHQVNHLLRRGKSRSMRCINCQDIDTNTFQ